MSPERFEAARTGARIDANAADVFALGCILAEMRSGRPLVSEPILKEDVGEDTLLLRGYGAVAEQFRRNFACEAIAKNQAQVLTRRLDRALEGATAPLSELLRAMLDVRSEARPTAREVAERLAGLV
jgi:hypothetical protein